MSWLITKKVGWRFFVPKIRKYKCSEIEKEFGSFEVFKEQMRKTSLYYNGNEQAGYTDPAYGVVQLEDTARFYVGDTEVPYATAPELKIEKGVYQK